MLLIANHELTVHCNKYEHVWDSQVYSIQVYSKLYTASCCYLQVYKFIVYSKLIIWLCGRDFNLPFFCKLRSASWFFFFFHQHMGLQACASFIANFALYSPWSKWAGVARKAKTILSGGRCRGKWWLQHDPFQATSLLLWCWVRSVCSLNHSLS